MMVTQKGWGERNGWKGRLVGLHLHCSAELFCPIVCQLPMQGVGPEAYSSQGEFSVREWAREREREQEQWRKWALMCEWRSESLRVERWCPECQPLSSLLVFCFFSTTEHPARLNSATHSSSHSPLIIIYSTPPHPTHSWLMVWEHLWTPALFLPLSCLLPWLTSHGYPRILQVSQRTRQPFWIVFLNRVHMLNFAHCSVP